jgi:hypothetical protein
MVKPHIDIVLGRMSTAPISARENQHEGLAIHGGKCFTGGVHNGCTTLSFAGDGFLKSASALYIATT